MDLSRRTLDDPCVTSLGKNLREARLRLKLTQEQVADRTGIQAGAISLIEAGKRDPQVSTLIRLAKAVEVPPGSLLDGVTDMDSVAAEPPP